MVDPDHTRLSLVRQCRFVSIARSSFYDEGTGERPLNLRLMRSIDAQFLETPFYGSRQMQRWLRRQGDTVSRKRVRRLLRLLGVHAVFQRPRTSQSHPGHRIYPYLRKCCNFESGDGSRFGIEVSCRHLEQPVDELNLAPHIRAAHPPRLPLPNHVHGLVSLDCPPRRVKLAKPLFGLYPSFDRSMVLLQDIVHVLARPMAAAAAQGAFLFHGWNRRAVEAGLIGVDDAGLRMRWIAERLAKQPFGRRSIAER